MYTYTEAEICERLEEIKKEHWDYQCCATGFWYDTLKLMRDTNSEVISIEIIDGDEDDDYSKEICISNSNGFLKAVSLKLYSPEAFETLELTGWC